MNVNTAVKNLATYALIGLVFVVANDLAKRLRP